MRATVHPPLHSERTLRCLVIATTFVLLCAQTDYASAVAPEAVPSACVTATDATADDLAERFTAEILSRHPDHMARLYAPDAALQGLASSALRTDYAGVREYFLYFLQYNPLVKFEERRLEVGCNFLINAGNYTWVLRARNGSPPENVPARYRFVYEFSGGDWHIAEHVEELTGANADETAFAIPDPQAPRFATPIAAAVPTVAGFLQRSNKPQPEPLAPTKLGVKVPISKPSKTGATPPASAPEKMWQPENDLR